MRHFVGYHGTTISNADKILVALEEVEKAIKGNKKHKIARKLFGKKGKWRKNTVRYV
ncbi:hypothetical protein [Neobacillus sp. YIM B06451]|uniref:hypothetical protein n=1 Tax=Neobacillus sp. YIM B06451 TaxID=3070994 RepID=UPI00292D05B9|nr:hypothetical protein [Neobacillus sp. YIM B06451]